MRQIIGIVICFLMTSLIGWNTLFAQTETPKIIQFSGIVVTEENGQMIPVPYANVYSPNRKIGVTSNFSGFFSIVVERGEKIEFSAVGFDKAKTKIPDNLTDDRYSMVQIMTKDTILLPEAVIFPWPNRDYLKTEFLAMNVDSELQQNAMENLAEESMRKARNTVPTDGKETGTMYLRQQARSYYTYGGQRPPMNIFSPLAWADFFKAWKRGDFKKKQNDD